VSKKVREAQIRQTNYMLTIGDQELENSTLSIRTRDNYVVQGVKLSEFIASIEQECKTRSQESSYTKTA
jgi:threonyl-tRNA synthetase